MKKVDASSEAVLLRRARSAFDRLASSVASISFPLDVRTDAASRARGRLRAAAFSLGRRMEASIVEASAGRGLPLLEKALVASSEEWAFAVENAVRDAREESRVVEILTKHGPRARVQKVVRDDSCACCKALYAEEGGALKIFEIKRLLDNGTNVGRRGGDLLVKGSGSTEWLPTAGPAHVGCSCFVRLVES